MKLLFNCFCFVGSSKFFSSKLTDVKIILQIKSTSDKKCFLWILKVALIE